MKINKEKINCFLFKTIIVATYTIIYAATAMALICFILAMI